MVININYYLTVNFLLGVVYFNPQQSSQKWYMKLMFHVICIIEMCTHRQIIIIAYFIYLYCYSWAFCLPGVVYFYRGKKQPRIVYEGSTYYLEKRTEKKTSWRCAMYFKTKCTARVSTFGKTLKILFQEHNHEPTNTNCSNLDSYIVNII